MYHVPVISKSDDFVRIRQIEEMNSRNPTFFSRTVDRWLFTHSTALPLIGDDRWYMIHDNMITRYDYWYRMYDAWMETYCDYVMTAIDVEHWQRHPGFSLTKNPNSRFYLRTDMSDASYGVKTHYPSEGQNLREVSYLPSISWLAHVGFRPNHLQWPNQKWFCELKSCDWNQITMINPTNTAFLSSSLSFTHGVPVYPMQKARIQHST